MIPLNESLCSETPFFPFFLLFKKWYFLRDVEKNIAKQITLDGAIFIPPIYLLLIILDTLLSKHEWSESTTHAQKK